jgi:hypothetical protein
MPREQMIVLMSLKEVTELTLLLAGNPEFVELSNRLMDIMAEFAIDDLFESEPEVLEGMKVKVRIQ